MIRQPTPYAHYLWYVGYVTYAGDIAVDWSSPYYSRGDAQDVINLVREIESGWYVIVKGYHAKD